MLFITRRENDDLERQLEEKDEKIKELQNQIDNLKKKDDIKDIQMVLLR